MSMQKALKSQGYDINTGVVIYFATQIAAVNNPGKDLVVLLTNL